MSQHSATFKKITIIGTSGSGKTTLAKKLSSLLNIPVQDLDDFYWLPHWTVRDREEFVTLLEDVLRRDQWIISGNYSRHTCQVWESSDMIIWMDYPLHKCLWRALKRSIRRIVKKEACCNGNLETWPKLFSSQSILWWVLSTHKKRKEKNGQFFSENQDKEIILVRICKLSQEKEFLRKVAHGDFKL